MENYLKIINLLQETANYEEELVVMFSGFLQAKKFQELSALPIEQRREIKDIVKILRDDSKRHKAIFLSLAKKYKEKL